MKLHEFICVEVTYDTNLYIFIYSYTYIHIYIYSQRAKETDNVSSRSLIIRQLPHGNSCTWVHDVRLSCARLHELPWGQWRIGNNRESILSAFLYMHIEKEEERRKGEFWRLPMYYSCFFYWLWLNIFVKKKEFPENSSSTTSSWFF